LHALPDVGADRADGATIGAQLKQARIARKQSIEDVSRATKINTSMIRAIESDAFAKLPGGLFTRGFLRAYAREVGVDPEEIVDRYRSEFDGEAPAPAEPAQPEEQVISSVRPPVVVDEETTYSRRIQILQLFVIVLIVALYFSLSRRPRTEASSDTNPDAPVAEAQKAEPPNPEPPKAENTPVATNGTAVNAPPQKGVTLELRPQGPCWVQATAEGQKLYAKLMDAGETASVTVNNDVTLRVGDPGTLAFTLDGAPGRPLGPPGQPVTVHISPENYKTFLASQP